MDWEKAYDRLRQAKLKGRIVNSEDSIKKIKTLSEWHRKMFIEYFEATSTGKLSLSSFKSFRYPILGFLLQDNINNKFFNELTQDDIDDFLISKGENVELTTLNNNKNALKNYLDFYAKNLTFSPKYLDIRRDEINLKNKVSPLSSEKLEDIRNIIKDEPYLRFIFELAYENGVRFEDSKEYCKKNYDEKAGVFTSTTGELIKISDKLKCIIDDIKYTDEFKNPYYKQGFSKEKLYAVLKKAGFGRQIKSSDVNVTFKKNTSFKCPECGGYYEATADNWVIKQYHQDGQMWIVCKEKCGVKIEDL